MVDIVMATYNGSQFLRKQIDSILDQSYTDTRLIVRDDGSTDETVSILKEYAVQYPGKFLLIKDDVVCGSSPSNFMHTLSYTDADYIMFSDQDDVWLPNKVAHTLEKMQQIESEVGKHTPVLVFGSLRPVDANLKSVNMKKTRRQEARYKLSFSNLLVQNYVSGCLMMINRTLANMMGVYEDGVLMHDWWAALIASGSGIIEHVDEIMMLYRQHENNVVGAVDVKSFKYRYNKLKNPKTKYSCTAYEQQASLLLDRNKKDLHPVHLRELMSFVDLPNHGKLIRMGRLLKGHYLKSDLVRIIGQLWYI